MTLSEQQIAELKRENAAKHYRIVELEAQLEAIGAGGVEPLRKREPVRDFPKGAIHNGRAFADRLESGDFACEAGSLAMCCDWQEFRRCFENLAEWIALQADPPAQAQEDASVVYVTVETLRKREQEPVGLLNFAVWEDGVLRLLSGRKGPAFDCELFAMPDGRRAPNLYAAPPAQAVPEIAANAPDLLPPMGIRTECEVLVAEAVRRGEEICRLEAENASLRDECEVLIGEAVRRGEEIASLREQRKPMTDERIEKATCAKRGEPLFLSEKGLTLAVERAQGIGGGNAD